MSEQKEPTADVEIVKKMKNVPVTQEDLQLADEASSRSGRPNRKYRMPPDHSDDDGDEFPLFLQDPQVKITVERASPREYKGHNLAGFIEEFVPPVDQSEIEADVRDKHGGGRYRIVVKKNGKFVGARGFNIAGDPTIPGDDEDDDFEIDIPHPSMRPTFMPGPGALPHPDKLSKLRTDIEEEKLRQELEQTKAAAGARSRKDEDIEIVYREREERLRREFEAKTQLDGLRNEFDQKFQAMMRQIAETLSQRPAHNEERDVKVMELDNKIERIKTEILGEVKSTFADVRASLQGISQKPEKPDSTPQLFHAMIEGFSKMSASSETKLQAIAQAETAKTQAMLESMKVISDAQTKVSQAQTDKLVTVLQSQMDNKGNEIDKFAKTVNVVRDLMDNMNPNNNSAAEAVAEAPDLPSKIVAILEKALPTILAAQAQANQGGGGGRPLSEQELQSMIISRAQQMAPAMAAQYLRQQGLIRPPMPAPPQVPVNGPQAWGQKAQQQMPQAPIIAPAVQAQASQPQVIQQPDVQPAVPQQVQSPIVIDGEKETANRVNTCMEVLLHEIALRPRQAQWVDAAFDDLPETILDKLVLVTSAEELYTLIRPYAKPEFVEKLIEIFRAEEKAVAWFTSGLDELKGMYADDKNGVE